MKKLKFCFAKSIAAIAVFYFALVSATTSADAAESSSDANSNRAQTTYELPAVVVTADKRPTELQKTPMAITVFTAQDIEDNNIRTVRDALARVPNLVEVSDLGGNTKISFRGALTSTATETSPMVMYVDGVPVDSFAYLDANLMDIERIEVLRGAQSTIYGKNAFSGVVNIISKKPDNDFRAKITSYAGTEYSYGLGATLSGPIVEDRLFFSLSAGHDYRDGYMRHPNSDESNRERNERVKGQLRLLPTDDSEINFYVDYTAKRKGFVPYVIGSSATMKSPAYDDDYRNDDILNMALHGAFDFDKAALKSITTFRRDTMNAILNTTPIMAPIYGAGIAGNSGYDNMGQEFTQELRLQSPEDQKNGINWLVGIYGGYKDFQRKELSLKSPLMETDYPYREFTKDLAPFAQIEVPITESLKITAGLRWQHTERSASINYEFYGVSMFHARPDKTWEEWLPKLVLSYDITDNHMVYAGVNRSFLPGGFNYSATSDLVSYTYDPQTAWNYEIGAKTSWFDKRLNANLALFYSEYDDMQVMQYDPISMGFSAENAAESSAYGLEFELDGQITSRLRALLALGYTHAKYDDYKRINTTGAFVYSGNKVQQSPEVTGNLSLVYRHENGFMAQTGAQYVSKMYWAADNIDSRSDVVTVDAKIGYEGDSWDVYLYGTNIFGERYMTTYDKNMNMGIMAAPQEFGVQMAYRF